MPTREAIVDSILPREIERPIPVRTVSTRSTPRVQNINQAPSSVDPAAATATPEESVRLSPQLSALARKEQAYRQREQALKQREKDLEARLAEAEQYSQLKTKIGSKDYSAAEALGLTYEEYTKYLLEKQSGEDPQTQRFKSLEDEIQALKKSTEESATKEYEATVAEYKTAVTSLIDSDPRFARTKKFEDEDAEGKPFTGKDVALQLILDAFDKDGESLTIEEACNQAEQYLEAKAKKWSALNEKPTEVIEEVKLPPPRMGSRTLTQQMQASGTEKTPAKSLQFLPEHERYAEARRRALAKRQQG